ncbi:YDG domain-containing protein [Rubritalea sp.]|uniref:two-partner secretion domain-containing protein n=1 Tax=Rubritalea sp. TaxID=2109375 RepID=UPI003EF53528
MTTIYRKLKWGVMGVTLLSPSLLHANPSGGVVSSGDATIHSSGNTLTIDQLTDQAIINWQDFSIGSGELTQFNQLSRSSAVLNRVVGNNLSAIHGRLQANGQVFLINQNGIVVGDQGVIQTAGFVGSTHRLSDSDFLAGGDLNFTAGDQGGAIINLGEISVSGGDVFLIADQVANHGSITATDGTVGLAAAAGAEVTLADSGEQRLLVQPSTSVTGKDGVVNQGSINAVNAELKAAGGNVYALGINNNGAIRATGVQNVGGRILLTSKGGKIKLGSNSNINASGAEGGGQVNIGGSKLGEGPIDNAAEVIVEAGSEIAADALENGDGGEVIIFAEHTADLDGGISARGGALGGDGGFIETSGKESWNYQNWLGQVDVTAANGKGGEFLIDPNDITISSAGTGTSGSNNLNNTDIVTFLNGGSSLTIATDPLATGGNGDITINDAVLYDSTADFTLLAGRNLNFNASVQNSNDTGGDLNLVAGWDGMTAYDFATFDGVDLSVTDLFGNNSGSVNVGDGAQTVGIAVGSRSGVTNVFGHDLTLTGGGAATFAQLGFQATDQGFLYNITGGITVGVLNNITALSGSGNFSYTQIGHVGADRTPNNLNREATTDATITIAAGGDLSFTGGGIDAYSQLGHGGYFGRGNFSGAITIMEANDLTFTGGGGYGAYSQLGHGGRFGRENNSGAITIMEANDLIFTGGGRNASSQLGHGGVNALGNNSGAITITEANDLIFTGGGIDASSQLGHGGHGVDGNHSGAITITEANDLTFTGGGGRNAYSQLGHGGWGALGNHSGAITIMEANDLTFTGGGGNYAYSQLGHGGWGALGNHSGSITITEASDLIFTGGGVNAYSQLGHGSADFGRTDQATGTRSGDITVTASGEISLQDGANSNANYAWIGHGSADNAATDADITLTAASYDRDTSSGVTAGGDGSIRRGIIENGLLGGDVTIAATGSSLEVIDGSVDLANLSGGEANDGNFSVTNNLTLLASHDLNLNTSIQNSLDVDGGEIRLIAGWDGVTTYDFATFDGADLDVTTLFGNNSGSVNIGDGAQTVGIAVGSRSGETNVFGNDLTLTGSDATDEGFAQLGFQASNRGAGYNITGGITVDVLNDIIAESGSGQLSYTQIGHVGADRNFGNQIEATTDATITIAVGGDLTFTGDGAAAYSQLGHGGLFARGNHSGDIMITEANDLTFTGGSGNNSYSQLGHGGRTVFGNHSGAITITEANDVTFTAGGGSESYSQLGHGGAFASGNHSGVITITEVNDLVFTGGVGFAAYSQLGHGGRAASGNHSGAITITEANNLTFTGGGELLAYSQLGHGGEDASGNHSGAITITEANDLTFTGVGGNFAYSQLGHGGVGASGNHSGVITITEVNDLVFTGGGSIGASSQLGHGGRAASGNHSGAITITEANDLIFTGGIGNGASYSQLGHGGRAASGNHSGVITITEANDLTFTGGVGNNSYSQLGHGSADFENGGQSTGTRSGDITVTVSGEVSLQDGTNSNANYAWIGHGSADNNAAMNANITLTAASYDADANILAGSNGSIRRGIIENGLLGGDVTITATGSSLEVIDGSGNLDNLSGVEVNDGSYDSANDLLIIANNDLILGAGATLNNVGAGNIIFSAGENFHNDTGSLTPVTTSIGRSLIYSSRPDVNRNDIEITNMDFLSFGQNFSVANPIASALPSGDGLIYTEIPMVTTTAADQVITYGETAPTSTVIQSASYGGNVIDTAEWGLSLSGSTTNAAGISGVLDAGSYNDAYTANATVAGLGGEAVEGVTELFNSGDLTVNQRGLTISSNADDKVYDTTTGADVTFGDDRVVGDALTITSISDAFSDENVGINKVVTSTGLALSGADAANYFITNATNEVETTADITPALLTISDVSAIDKYYDGSVLAILMGGQLDGILGGESVDLITGSGVFYDAESGYGKPILTSGYGISGADSSNYQLSMQPAGVTGNILLSSVVHNTEDPGEYRNLINQFVADEEQLTDGVNYFGWLPQYNQEIWELIGKEQRKQANGESEEGLSEEDEKRLNDLLSEAFSTAAN